MKISRVQLIISSIILLFLFSCTQPEETKPVRIAISKAYPAYIEWLKAADSTVVLVDLYHTDFYSAMILFEECDGILLTGGPDVSPDNYGRGGDTAQCGTIDYRRDTLEFALIKLALERNIPIFGVCRGQQILNVAMGGSLFVDIPTEFDSSLSHRCADKDTCFHTVSITENSFLHKIIGVNTGLVNTNHHQAINKPANNILVAAVSDDGLVEAIEWKNPEGLPFMLAVQWHPERLERENPLSGRLADAFIKAVNLLIR